MFSPIKSAIFFLSVLIAIAIISFLPSKSIYLTNNFFIRLPHYSILESRNEVIKNKKDSVLNKIQKIEKQTISQNDTIVPVYDGIQYPADSFEALKNFFEALSKDKKIHIFHYGDSQIEGDRITGELRSKFQNFFGGQGAGIIFPMQVNGVKQAISVDLEGTWTKYSILTYKKMRFGPAMQFLRYKNTFDDDTSIYDASLTFYKNSFSYQSNYRFKWLRILYGNLRKGVLVQVYTNEEFFTMKMLNPTMTENIENIEITPVEKIKLEFTGRDSPDIYGIAFETDQGVFVDNFSLRGTAGTFFTGCNASNLAFFLNQLNVRLVILQFGVNVVPNIQSNYSFYENWLYSQINFLKQLKPDLDVLVVGVSDMSLRTDSGLVSYPNIEAIRDAQRRAAFRANCAFWDTYKAMGGKNSMPVWVEKGLASKDYTHFTIAGAKTIANLLFNAIYNDYKKYLSRKKAENNA